MYLDRCVTYVPGLCPPNPFLLNVEQELTRMAFPSQTSALIAQSAVGIILIVASAMKAFMPQDAARHVAAVFPGASVVSIPLAFTLIGTESAWGTALLTGLIPHILLPITAVALLGFMLVIGWARRTGRITSCGCYGGRHLLSDRTSSLLTLSYIMLSLFAWDHTASGMPEPQGSSYPAILAGFVASAIAASVFWWERRAGRLLLHASLVRPGRGWLSAWSSGDRAQNDEEVLFALLGTKCFHCAQWILVLNAFAQVPRLPRVVGIIGGDAASAEEYAKIHSLRFPVVAIAPHLHARLAPAVPKTVLVSGGVVETSWEGLMPKELTRRFAAAVFGSVDVS